MGHRCLARRGVLLAGACLCLTACGCLGGYAYPRYFVVPPTAVGAPRKEVQAFRLDISVRNVDFKPQCARRVLTPIPIEKSGCLGSQALLTVESAWGMPRLPSLDLPDHQWNSMRVILYRPGYRSIKLGPSEARENVKWQKIETPEEQEEAVDDLVACDFGDLPNPQASAPGLPTPPAVENASADESARAVTRFNQALKELVPGASSDGHRDSLFYAASQYERVSGLISWQQKDKIKMRYRLTEKAARLRLIGSQ